MLCLLKATFNSERSEDAAACEFGAENRGRSTNSCDSWSMVATGSNFVHELPTSTENFQFLLVSIALPVISLTSCYVVILYRTVVIRMQLTKRFIGKDWQRRHTCRKHQSSNAHPKTLQTTVCSRGSRALMTRRTFDTEY